MPTAEIIPWPASGRLRDEQTYLPEARFIVLAGQLPGGRRWSVAALARPRPQSAFAGAAVLAHRIGGRSCYCAGPTARSR